MPAIKYPLTKPDQTAAERIDAFGIKLVKGAVKAYTAGLHWGELTEEERRRRKLAKRYGQPVTGQSKYTSQLPGPPSRG